MTMAGWLAHLGKQGEVEQVYMAAATNVTDMHLLLGLWGGGQH